MASPSSTAAVQHVPKASSDQLLRKFAELDSDTAPSPRSAKLIQGPTRRKKSKRVASGLAARDVSTTSTTIDSPAARKRRKSGTVAEWKSLLPTTSRRTPLRNAGIGRFGEGAGIGFLLAALEKAWRKTMEGATKMMMEKQRINGHVRLISDAV